MPPRALAPAAVCACLALLTGCAVRREAVVPVIDARTVGLRLDPEGPWNEVAPEARPADPASVRAAEERALALTRQPLAPGFQQPMPPRPVIAPEDRLAVPSARGLSEATPKGRAPTRALEDVARERFLDHPTEIKAAQITLYAPPKVLAEGRLTGGEVSEPTAGRRVAVGGASLKLRELTLTAERITLRTRDGAPDIQITARGDVHLVSRQRDQVLREEGLKSLILTNDQVTPLR